METLKQATLCDILSYAAAILSIFFTIWTARYYKKAKNIFQLKELWTVIAIASESKIKVSELIVMISAQSLGIGRRGKSFAQQLLFLADRINKSIIEIESEMPAEILDMSPINNVRTRAFYQIFLSNMSTGGNFSSSNLNEMMDLFADVVSFCKNCVEDKKEKLSN